MNYIILGPGRCGSTMLRTALEYHPQIDAFSEYLKPQACRELGRTYAEQHAIVFGSDRAASGCVVFYHHIPSNDERWGWLRDNCQVIHLLRQNVGRWYLSWVIAKTRPISTAHEKYDIRDADNIATVEDRRVAIDIAEMRSAAREYRENVRWARGKFAGECYHEIPYERLCSDWESAILEIQRILGVEPIPLTPKTCKANSEGIDELVENSDEFRAEINNYEYWIEARQ